MRSGIAPSAHPGRPHGTGRWPGSPDQLHGCPVLHAGRHSPMSNVMVVLDTTIHAVMSRRQVTGSPLLPRDDKTEGRKVLQTDLAAVRTGQPWIKSGDDGKVHRVHRTDRTTQ